MRVEHFLGMVGAAQITRPGSRAAVRSYDKIPCFSNTDCRSGCCHPVVHACITHDQAQATGSGCTGVAPAAAAAPQEASRYPRSPRSDSEWATEEEKKEESGDSSGTSAGTIALVLLVGVAAVAAVGFAISRSKGARANPVERKSYQSMSKEELREYQDWLEEAIYQHEDSAQWASDQGDAEAAQQEMYEARRLYPMLDAVRARLYPGKGARANPTDLDRAIARTRRPKLPEPKYDYFAMHAWDGYDETEGHVEQGMTPYGSTSHSEGYAHRTQEWAEGASFAFMDRNEPLNAKAYVRVVHKKDFNPDKITAEWVAKRGPDGWVWERKWA